MIPILYDSTETQFTSGGICYLGECISCLVEEEKNGIYECEFQYPISGKYYSEIEEKRYIVCTHEDSDDRQPFRIYKHTAPINGVVTFYAHHISEQLTRIIVEPYDASTAASALTQIPSKSINTNPFSFDPRKSGNGNFSVKAPSSVKSILGGTEGSILDVFNGGEYEFDKWTVRLYDNRGSETEVTIRYGKNMVDIEHTLDIESLYDSVVPYWRGRTETTDGDGTTIVTDDAIVMLPAGSRIVSREGVTNPQAKALDLSSQFETAPTELQLRSAAESYLQNNKPWEPSENIEVDFVQLWQTQEYENVASLQRVKLCDKVNVYYPALGVQVEGIQVIRTVYNVLLDRYDKMELGSTRTNFMERIEQDTQEKIKQSATVFETLMKAEVERATNLLLNPGSSHVLFYKGTQVDGTGSQSGTFTISGMETGNGAMQDPEGILIMDTANPSTASDVLIINRSGIGFSRSGINGPYTSSWTLDGRFTADFIATWEIMVNLIRLYGLMEVHENAEATMENGQLVDPIGGYIGFGYGRIDNTANGVTKGIMLSNTDKNDGKNSRYLIATDSGIRMTAGDNSIYLTDNLVQGQASGNAVIQVVNDLIFSIGDKIKVKDNNVVGATEYEGATTGSSSDGYTLQIGPARLKFFKGICIGATAWSQASYDELVSRIGSGGGGGGGSGGTAVFG